MNRTEIIAEATRKARKQWSEYLRLQEAQIFKAFRDYSRYIGEQLAKAEQDGKIPWTRSQRLQDNIKQSIPPFRKSLAASIKRGVSNSVDYAFKAQILGLDAAGIAKKIIMLGTSHIGADGQVVRWNAAKETFLKSTWSRMNHDAVNAVLNWKPGGLAFSDRVWEITWQSQKQLIAAIQRGVMEGRSAATISRDIRGLLALPDRFYGDVLKDFHPGTGVYRSAYKNAVRLARTELNRAFHEGTLRYAKQKTWIEGYIWRAGSAEPCEICSPNRDKFFPKDSPPDLPAHPNCRCYVSLFIEGDPKPGEKGFEPGLGPDGKPIAPAA